MPTAAQTPGPLLGQETGLPDDQWIADIRASLEDWPIPLFEQKSADGVSGVFGPGTLPYRVTRPRVNDTTGDLQVSVGNVTFPVDTVNPPAAGKIYCDFQTGNLYFASAPAAAATIKVSYKSVRWLDSQILTSLMAGLRNMFPKFGKVQVDTGQIPQVDTWDYDLPAWLRVPGSRIIRLEVRDPDVSIQPWRELLYWDRSNGLNQFRVYNAQAFSPAGRFRITGWGPYAELRDVEPQLYHLPIWYALGTLYLKKEGPRLRDDRAQPVSQEGGSAPGEQTKLGEAYMATFWNELERMPRMPGPTNRMRLLPSYGRTYH